VPTAIWLVPTAVWLVPSTVGLVPVFVVMDRNQAVKTRQCRIK